LGTFLTWWDSVRQDRVTAPESVVLARVPDPSGRSVPDTGATAAVGTQTLPVHGDVVDAVRWGAHRADSWADEGVDLVLLALGDPVPARVVAAHLLGIDPIAANDWPREAGLDDPTWAARTARTRDGLARIRPVPRSPAPVLTALGDPLVAAATAVLLRCSARRTPVLLDGPGAAAVALLARTSAPAASSWWQAAHLTRHPLHERLLTAARLEPLLTLEIEAENGTGSLAALALLEFALRLRPSTAPTGSDTTQRDGGS
jgi:nicotinate-nucleotide--dimethylbenzimidazole phosphoribosyltransferase